MKRTNFINKKISEQSGITLVALVVTIIILLVLAGITVASLTGDNGLIGKTGEAKKQTEISEGTEQLEIAVNQSFNKRGNIDTAKLAKNLSKINGLKYINGENQEIDISENSEIKLTAKVKLKGNTFKINDEGNVSYKKEGTIDNKDIINSPETYYGHYVTNYNSPNDVGIQNEEGQPGKWQIFMADEDNIFLIASNFISRYYTGTKNEKGFNYDESILDTKTVYKMWFSNIAGQYNADQTTTDIPKILSKLDKQTIYHKWLINSDNQKRNQSNEKAVASMLDVDIWNRYNNTTYAKYAIGGPTIEMLCKAYNDSHTGDKLEALENDSGYEIRKGENGNPEGLVIKAKNTLVDNMYFKLFGEENVYWLASPYNNSYRNIKVESRGAVTSSYVHRATGNGFRPLVCLNSNVHLVKNDDGETYSLELD